MSETRINRRTVLRYFPLFLGSTASFLAWFTKKSGATKPGSSDSSTKAIKQKCLVTRADVKGPYYLQNAPSRTVLVSSDEPGDHIVIRGTVKGSDCKTPLAGAHLDIWQADANGNYYNETQNYRLRGQMLTDANGMYAFESVRPGHYLYNNSLRPAHIHFIVTSTGYQSLTTQLYFKGDPYLAPNDPCEQCDSDDTKRIIKLLSEQDSGGGLSGTFDIVLKPNSTEA